MSMGRLRVASAVLALALSLAAIAAGTATAKTKVISSGPLKRVIPDPSGGLGAEIAPSIKVEARGRVRDVDVLVRIAHPNSREIELGASHIPGGGVLRATKLKEHGTLADPAGADFGAGGSGCVGATFTVFDDASTASILAAAPPFIGRFAPLEPLAVLNGSQLRGRWYLDVLDFSPGGTGVIECWQMKIRYTPAPKKRRK
jgi:hypothetical protein